MKFPDHIVGPKFENGDIVNFSFDDATLIFRIPNFHHNSRTIDRVSEQTDFKCVDVENWSHFGDEGHCSTSIVVQDWVYEDEISHDDIAHALLKITILKHSDLECKGLLTLNSQTFGELILTDLAELFSDCRIDERPYWPTKKNNFFARSVRRNDIDGLQVQLDLGGGEKYPVPTAFFSLGKCFSMRVEFHFGSLHYPDRKNPFSEDLLQQFKADLFDDLLSHIHIEYTPETVALIEQLKQQNE